MSAPLRSLMQTRRHTMHAEVIAIGDEITCGELLDSNTRWLSRRLGELGIRVSYHTAVGDQFDEAAAVFRQAIGRADVVVATGGLGPTADDLTRQAIAEATGRKLVLDPQALEHVRRLFARRKRQMPKQNEQQAMIPEGGRMVCNPHGTAPGIDLEVPREGSSPCRVFALPGVPAEMKQMWYDSAADSLAKIGGSARIIRHKQIKCFGAGESHIESMLPDLIRRGREPRVGINASQTTIILRITAEGATEQECYAAMEPTIATIRRCLGTLVFGEDDEELQDAVVRLLRGRNLTLATAEWGTAGLIAHWLGSVADAEGHYVGGLIVTDEATLTSVLGLDPDLPKQHLATSSEVARAMAVSCRRRFQSDYSLAVGRFPEFDPEADEPNPVHFALAAPDGVEVTAAPYTGHPAALTISCAKRALNIVRLALLEDG